MHRRCASNRAPNSELPLALREAYHRHANEVMVLQRQVKRVKETSDELNDLVTHMQSQGNAS